MAIVVWVLKNRILLNQYRSLDKLGKRILIQTSKIILVELGSNDI